jgi:hypothetical protein
LLLHRRARQRTVRAEHAAVAALLAQQRAARRAFVEEPAGIRGHRLARDVPARRTPEIGLRYQVVGHR